MSDAIPEKFMTAALVAVEKISRAPYFWDTEARATIIASALMAAAKEADEAATMRERERCLQAVISAGRQILAYAEDCEAKNDADGQFAAVSAGVGIERAIRAVKGEA